MNYILVSLLACCTVAPAFAQQSPHFRATRTTVANATPLPASAPKAPAAPVPEFDPAATPNTRGKRKTSHDGAPARRHKRQCFFE